MYMRQRITDMEVGLTIATVGPGKYSCGRCLVSGLEYRMHSINQVSRNSHICWKIVAK